MTTIALNGFHLDAGELEKARRRKITPYKCAALSGNVKNLAKQIENDWDKLTDSQKDSLKRLAYRIVDSDKKPNLLDAIMVGYRAFYASLKGYPNNIGMLADAVDELIDSIFSAIESEDLARACAEFDVFYDSDAACPEQLGEKPLSDVTSGL
jgi:hypothetical protein